MLLFIIRMKVSLKFCHFLLFCQVVFSTEITDLAMVNELLHYRLYKPCPQFVFLFWSGLPLTCNELISPHKSDLYTPFHFFFLLPFISFSLPCFSWRMTSFSRKSYFLLQKAARQYRPFFSPGFGDALLHGLKGHNVNHRKAITRKNTS